MTATLNVFTIDVEDYYQVSAFAGSIDRDTWPSYESRVEQNTHRLLNLLDKHRTKGTFFVLGWVAERCPTLVRDIAACGHEIACHGYSHRLVYDQTPAGFRDEVSLAKRILEETSGRRVVGYRAASFPSDAAICGPWT